MKITKIHIQKLVNEETEIVLNEFKKWLRKRAEKAMVKKAQKSATQHATKIAAIKAEYEATGNLAAKALLKPDTSGYKAAFVILQQPGKGMSSQYISKATGVELTEIEFKELANQVAKNIVAKEGQSGLKAAAAGELPYIRQRALRAAEQLVKGRR